MASALFFHSRDRRSGVVVKWWPFLAASLGPFALLVLVSPAGLSLLGLPARLTPWSRAGDLFVRGLTPILTIALGLLVLSAIERSRPFAAFAAGFLALALVVDLYDIGNVTYRLGLGQHGVEANVLTAGVALMIGGIGFAIAAWRKG